MHAMAATIVLVNAWEAMPMTMKQAIPVKWVIALACVMLVGGMIGRVVKQPDAQPEEHQCGPR